MTSLLPSAAGTGGVHRRRARLKRLRWPMPEVSGLRLRSNWSAGVAGSSVARHAGFGGPLVEVSFDGCAMRLGVVAAGRDPCGGRHQILWVVGQCSCLSSSTTGGALVISASDSAASTWSPGWSTRPCGEHPTWPMMHRIRGPVIRLDVETAAWSRACSAWAHSPDVAGNVAAGLDHGGVSDGR
jgi:hypothetical protein